MDSSKNNVAFQFMMTILKKKYEIFKTSSINHKKGYKNLVDEGLIDQCVSYVCNVCLNCMPGQSKIHGKASNQSNISNDNNMGIDSDIREEKIINEKIMSKCETLWMGWTLWESERVFVNYNFAWDDQVKKTLYNDKLAISKEYKDIDKSKSVEPKLWLKNWAIIK